MESLMNEERIIDLAQIGLNKDQIEKVSNIEFKKEHLGALEFDLIVTDAEFQAKTVKFRIERVPVETFLKLGNMDDLSKIVPKTLSDFIALPLEAKKADFFTYDLSALDVLSKLITEFQKRPIFFNV